MFRTTRSPTVYCTHLRTENVQIIYYHTHTDQYTKTFVRRGAKFGTPFRKRRCLNAKRYYNFTTAAKWRFTNRICTRLSHYLFEKRKTCVSFGFRAIHRTAVKNALLLRRGEKNIKKKPHGKDKKTSRNACIIKNKQQNNTVENLSFFFFWFSQNGTSYKKYSMTAGKTARNRLEIVSFPRESSFSDDDGPRTIKREKRDNTMYVFRSLGAKTFGDNAPVQNNGSEKEKKERRITKKTLRRHIIVSGKKYRKLFNRINRFFILVLLWCRGIARRGCEKSRRPR